jgi:hypothetical protein
MATEWQRLAFPNWLLRPSLFVDIDARFGQRILRAMPAPPDRARQLPWLRLHLFMRDVLAVPWGKDSPLASMAGPEPRSPILREFVFGLCDLGCVEGRDRHRATLRRGETRAPERARR